MRQKKEGCNHLQEQHREGQVTGRRRRRDRKRNRSDKEFMVHSHTGTKIERRNRHCKARNAGKALWDWESFCITGKGRKKEGE